MILVSLLSSERTCTLPNCFSFSMLYAFGTLIRSVELKKKKVPPVRVLTSLAVAVFDICLSGVTI
jgi:hypothetical protein